MSARRAHLSLALGLALLAASLAGYLHFAQARKDAREAHAQLQTRLTAAYAQPNAPTQANLRSARGKLAARRERLERELGQLRLDGAAGSLANLRRLAADTGALEFAATEDAWRTGVVRFMASPEEIEATLAALARGPLFLTSIGLTPTDDRRDTRRLLVTQSVAAWASARRTQVELQVALAPRSAIDDLARAQP